MHPGCSCSLGPGWAGQGAVDVAGQNTPSPYPHTLWDMIQFALLVPCCVFKKSTQLPRNFRGSNQTKARKEVVSVRAEPPESRGHGARYVGFIILGPHRWDGNITPRRHVSVLCVCGLVRSLEISCTDQVRRLSDCMRAQVSVGFLKRSALARH